MGIPLLAAIGGAIFFALGLPPVQRWVSYSLNSFWPNRELEVADLLALKVRGYIDEEKLKERLKAHGFAEDKVQELLDLERRLLTAEELVVAKWRKLFSEDEEENNKRYLEEMKKLGFTEEDAKKFEAIRKFYPSPADFIRFAVREVFNEEVVKQFGYDEEYPEAIEEYAKKAGMDPEVLRWYWRAHWDLPSPSAGYTMLHRLHPDVLDVIGEKYKKLGLDPEDLKTDINTVDTLLKIADIPSYWRKRLLAISYPPLDRVDLRRIYVLGLIGDEELEARLRELGYAPDDAKLMVQFYKQYKMSQEKDLTTSYIKKALYYKKIDEEKAKELLQDLGYDETEADLIVYLWKMEEEEDELKDRIDTIKTLYETGVISYEEAITQLDHLNLPALYRDKVMAEMERLRKRKIRLPSKTDVLNWFKKGIIDEEEFRDLMKKLNYKDEYIDHYIREIKGEAS